MDDTLSHHKKQARDILEGQHASIQDVLDLALKLMAGDATSLARSLLDHASKSAPGERHLALGQLRALCTYKDSELPTKQRLDSALEILRGADDLDTTKDQESLGLAGAICKRQWEVTSDRQYAEASLKHYQRGHEQGSSRDSGYTSINAAFLLDLLARLEEDDASGDDVANDQRRRAQEGADERRAKAKKIRTDLVESLEEKAEGLVKEHKLTEERERSPQREVGSKDRSKEWWVLATMAEAQLGLGECEAANRWLGYAKNLEFVPDWVYESTALQLATLARLHTARLLRVDERRHGVKGLVLLPDILADVIRERRRPPPDGAERRQWLPWLFVLPIVGLLLGWGLGSTCGRDGSRADGQQIRRVVVTNEGATDRPDVDVEMTPLDVPVDSTQPTRGRFDGRTWTVGPITTGGSDTLTLFGARPPLDVRFDDDRREPPSRYTIVVTNPGPDSWTDIVIRDPLPPDVVVDSVEVSAGTVTERRWHIPALPPSATATLTWLVGGGPPDGGADLQVTVRASPTTVAVGETVRFVIVVRNNGPADATEVTVRERLPAGMAFVPVGATRGRFQNGVWSVGSLALDSSATLTLDVVIRSGTVSPIRSDATAEGREEDPDLRNNAAAVSVTIRSAPPPPSPPTPGPSPDLRGSVRDDRDPVERGGQLTYTVTVTNAGRAADRAVVVTHELPRGVRLIRTTPPLQGNRWTLGALEPDDSDTLLVTVAVDSGATGPLRYQALISGARSRQRTITEQTDVVGPPPDTVPPVIVWQFDPRSTVLDVLVEDTIAMGTRLYAESAMRRPVAVRDGSVIYRDTASSLLYFDTVVVNRIRTTHADTSGEHLDQLIRLAIQELAAVDRSVLGGADSMRSATDVRHRTNVRSALQFDGTRGGPFPRSPRRRVDTLAVRARVDPSGNVEPATLEISSRDGDTALEDAARRWLPGSRRFRWVEVAPVAAVPVSGLLIVRRR